MRAVWKFPLMLQDSQSVYMPTNADLLTVQMQGEQICLWALCEPENGMSPRIILIHGTGNPIGDIEGYIGTVQMLGGKLVFHVFEGRA
jgi:hypothetical protein